MPRISDGGHMARLQRLAGPATVAAMGEALLQGAELIAASAKFSIIDGSISGSGHVPSLSGQPPNADTHDLDESIHVGELIETDNVLQTAVIADSDHAWIERGGSKMAPRPYMEPATELHRRDVHDLLVRGANKVVKG
jgi:hypothetical protein